MLVDGTCVACGGERGPVCAPCAAALRPVGPLAVDGLDRAWALMAYDGPARALIGALKFRNRRAAVGLLAARAGAMVDERVDAVTWVPAAPSHRRARGYDQGELLARRVGVAVGRPARRLLERPPDRPQTGLGRSARLEGPALRPRRAVSGAVLVVDDVVTTGGSLAGAARILRGAGAERVLGLVLAATPGPAVTM